MTLYNRYMRHIFLLASFPLIAALFAFSGVVHAQEEPDISATSTEDIESKVAEAASSTRIGTGPFAVIPAVINQKAKARDIIKEQLTVTNQSDHVLNLYADVVDIHPEGEAPPPDSLEASLARWIEVTRGVIELAPEESRTIPYLIHVNMRAVPGVYHARIRFMVGTTKAQAKEYPGTTSLLLTVEVEDDARERLELGGFVAEEPLVTAGNAGFNYKLENVGNRALTPRGEIRIFNRKGEEVGTVPINPDKKTIDASAKEQLAAVWDTAGRFGKYKAFLDIEYGENQLATVNDTVYFWVFPWKEVLFALIGIMVLAFLGTYAMHTRSVSRRPAPAYVPTQPLSSFPPEGSGYSEPPPRSVRNITHDAPAMRYESPATSAGSTVRLGARQAANGPAGHVVQLSPRRR